MNKAQKLGTAIWAVALAGAMTLGIVTASPKLSECETWALQMHQQTVTDSLPMHAVGCDDKSKPGTYSPIDSACAAIQREARRAGYEPFTVEYGKYLGTYGVVTYEDYTCAFEG